jgi:hypothetical protein
MSPVWGVEPTFAVALNSGKECGVEESTRAASITAKVAVENVNEKITIAATEWRRGCELRMRFLIVAMPPTPRFNQFCSTAGSHAGKADIPNLLGNSQCMLDAWRIPP